MRRSRDLRDAQDREGAQTIASALVPKIITIAAKSGPEGKLFGSVTVADVAHAVEEQTKVVIDRKNLHMDPIKSLGTHTVTAKLHSDVEFPITVEVVSQVIPPFSSESLHRVIHSPAAPRRGPCRVSGRCHADGVVHTRRTANSQDWLNPRLLPLRPTGLDQAR